MNEVSEILTAIDNGETASAEQLLPLVYRELRRLAGSKMASEQAGHTLQPTALVHEAYLRLAGPGERGQRFNSAGHFYGAAAEAMRRILIEHARGKQTQKRGGDFARTTWDEEKFSLVVPSEELIEIDEALAKLEAENEELAKIVKLRYFAGMSIPEIAAALGVSGSTIDRSWRAARAWLYREIKGESG
jgi:RNA polymerase sigma factor (TIGR02999 family)